MKQIGIDLSNIEMTINCSPEQLVAQVSDAALHLLRNTKPADQVRGSSVGQRVLERGSEACSGAKCEGVATFQDSSSSILPNKSHAVKCEEKSNAFS